jgi:hypothetical protein
MHRDRLPYLLIPLAAFLAIIPLLVHGCSCGHDFDFHLPTWFEAARQFTHGNFHPHWASTAAYNAGEPRFVFYPPLSWTIGAILGLIFPWTWTPIIYTWLALTAAGLALYHLAKNFTAPTAALIAAIIYTVNPYLLFTAYERTAYAELLAAAFIPLLLLAILRDRVTIPGIAIPIALLWLTNAPAAVLSCYALALLTLIRIATNSSNQFVPMASNNRSAKNPGAPYLDSEMWASRASATAPAHSQSSNASSQSSNASTQTRLQIALNTIAGTALGLGLAAFYIVPAAYERRYVQIAMAILPTMRVQDNFLFGHTTDAAHDQVLHTASLIALLLIALTLVALTIFRMSQHARVPHSSQSHREGWEEQTSTSGVLFISLLILTITIALLLTPLTGFLWNHAPELAFLQFPWRFLAVLDAVLTLSIALALVPLTLKPAITAALSLLIAATFTYPAYAIFHQTCDPEDTVRARLALFQSNQGTEPTDEYTPIHADNDFLAPTNPPYWLSSDPNAKAPANAQPGAAPTHFNLNTTVPENLILNLRNYPAWRITLNGTPIATRMQRKDGLIAFPIPAGLSTLDVAYTHSLDQTLGDAVSLASIAFLAIFVFRQPANPVSS